jgi:hypothetical protein
MSAREENLVPAQAPNSILADLGGSLIFGSS